MNNVMLGAMLGGWEILMILLVLVFMAGLAIGAVLLVVWLVRRGQPPPAASPMTISEGHKRPGATRRSWFVEIREDRPHLRWRIYFLGLSVAVFGSALLNGLLLAAGVWSGMDTVLFGLFVVVVVFHIFVIREFHQAGKERPVKHSASSRASPAGSPAPNRPAADSAASNGRCPRCGATLPPNSPQQLCPHCVLGVGLATQTEATGEFGPQGTRIVPPPEADVARRFPHLEILGCLGHGGMGVVYKARQPKLNRLVALKILAPEKGADPKFAERFLREAQALARLSHPNIVAVHDFGEADGMFFLLMEYVDGMTLRQLLREGLMKPEQALAIVPPICEALQFAHEQGVVHRDIKPENVLLDKQGRVKLADFGIAKLVGTEGPRSALTEERSIIGTPHYMAPEQVEKPQLVDHRADIYSLGVVFYEMLTGELPLGKFQPPSKKVAVDVRLDEVVLRALEKEPEHRYQKASQVKTDVESITVGAKSEMPRPEGETSESGPQRFSRTAIWGACCLALAVCAVAGAILAAGEMNSRDSLFTGLPRWRFNLRVVLAAQVFGAISVLAGSLLGWIAISQIRHSRGRLYGLGLAMFDALLLPLLALNGLIVWGWSFIGDGLAGAFIPHPGRGLFASLMVALMIASCVAASWLIIRAAWRAANRPLSNHQSAPPPGAADKASPPRSGSAWKVAAVIIAAVMLLLTIPLGALFLWVAWSYPAHQRTAGTAPDSRRVVRVEEKLRQEIEKHLGEAGWRVEGLSVSVTPNLKQAECRFGPAWKNGLSETPFNATIRVSPQRHHLWLVTGDGQFQFLRFSVDTSSEMATDEGSAPPMTSLVTGFGPVREMTLNDMDELRGAEALDLDSGKVLDLPKDIETRPEPERLRWLNNQSADLLLDNVKGRWGLLTTSDNELKLAPLRNESWDVISRESLAQALAAEPAGLEIKQGRTWRARVLAANAQPPLTFVFKTDIGAQGLIQITGFTEKPNSARLRFKLVNPSTAVAAASRVESPPVAQAKPGAFKLALTNGVSVEVVAVTRNPIENQRWWKPDGTPLPQSPGGNVVLHPAGMAKATDVGENEHALLVHYNFPPRGQSAQYQTRYAPKPEYLGTLEVQQDDRVKQVAEEMKRLGRKLTGAAGGTKTSNQIVGHADVVRFPAGATNAAVQCATAAGPWEPAAVFDGRQTKVLVENLQVLCTNLRQEANGKCLDVTHDVDRERYALRMMAVFNDGQRAEVGLHSGLLRARETQGYVILESGQRVENIQEFVLERTPWVRGEIRNVTLKPSDTSASARAAVGSDR